MRGLVEQSSNWEASLSITDSTMVDNSGDGGAAVGNYGGQVSIIQSTVVDNNGGPEGVQIESLSVVDDANESVTLKASIVAHSTDGPNCADEGVVMDGGYNLSDDGSCGFGNTSVSNTPVELDPNGLQQNGGPTDTVALEPGSPAIGFVADPSLCSDTDQRGVARQVPCDAGAVELVRAEIGITSPDSATFTPGLPHSVAVTTVKPGGEPPPLITEAGALPSDLAFTDNGNGTASIAGTPEPSDAGSYPVTITASNGVSPDATQSFTLTILPIGITTTSLPYGQTGKLYSANLSVVGGTGPYTWSVSGCWSVKTCSTGLSLNPSTGAITGTPMVPTSVPLLHGDRLVLTATFGNVMLRLTLGTSGVGTSTVNITPSANPAVSGPVIYSVSVTGAGPTPTGSVTVSDGEGGTCSVTLVSGAAGCAITESAHESPYCVTASYSGDSYYAANSGGIIETVEPATATIVLTPSSDPANQGSVTYTALVTGNSSTPTGSVAVSDGQGGSCTATLEEGLANCAIDESGLSSPFTITATYGGDQNYSTVIDIDYQRHRHVHLLGWQGHRHGRSNHGDWVRQGECECLDLSG